MRRTRSCGITSFIQWKPEIKNEEEKNVHRWKIKTCNQTRTTKCAQKHKQTYIFCSLNKFYRYWMNDKSLGTIGPVIWMAVNSKHPISKQYDHLFKLFPPILIHNVRDTKKTLAKINNVWKDAMKMQRQLTQNHQTSAKNKSKRCIKTAKKKKQNGCGNILYTYVLFFIFSSGISYIVLALYTQIHCTNSTNTYKYV